MLPYFYVYGLGGLIFAIGLVFAARGGWVSFRGPGRRNLVICAAIFGYFALLQGWQQFAPMIERPAVPYDGSADAVLAKTLRGHPIDYAIVVGYFVAIIAIGIWFGKGQKTTKDFFFGGRKFAWWLIAFSLVASVVGSYSFVKYSTKGFAFGLSSSQSYLNDWIWLPLILFGWLPILYFSRITSIPEYFGRRFGPRVRLWSTICLLVYLVGYVGVNLFTMGKVIHSLTGLSIPIAAAVVALVSASYVTTGGQTSVIMTDLLQGVMLLFTGCLIIVLGVDRLGGFNVFWEHLPRGHRLAFPNFNQSESFPTVGIFWQDAIANSAMMYFLNQGMMMRFMAARSLTESRRAVIAMVAILVSVAACVVGGGGWIAQALVHAGHLPATVKADEAFYVATDLISRPGVFGLVLAALTAALMSTVDTLITAVAAIGVNDIYKVYVKPKATETEMLRAARYWSIGVTVVGVALVPAFMQFESIYAAHGAFTAAVTPPLVVALLLSVFWPRYTRTAATWTLAGGLVAILISLLFPEIITPIAHGVPLKKVEAGLFAGMRQYKYMRALYGMLACSIIGVVATFLSKPHPDDQTEGLVWGTVPQALHEWRSFGARMARRTVCGFEAWAATESLDDDVPPIRISSALAEAIDAKVGDRVYVSDTRRWLGGLRSSHAVVAEIIEDDAINLGLPEDMIESIVTTSRARQPLAIYRT